jgi:perosamine synthetase
MDVNEIKILQSTSLKLALVKLNDTGLGTLFVVNENGELVGVITDGDIRRAILNDVNLANSVFEIMNVNFISMPVESDSALILEKLDDKVKVIPLIDNKKRLVDYSSKNKIRRISVASPLLNGNEIAYVTECIKTNWISSQGKFVKQFELMFSNYHENKNSLAVSNGTVALHLALEALGIGKGDEVIVPDLTFAASVNAIIYCGATPVLIDVDSLSWNLDINQLEGLVTEKTKAIMPVHLYGLPCDMEKIMAIAKKFKLYVIEDCAEALGSFYKNKPVGTFGDVATFSFYGNKTITTGEGGMLVFNDPLIYEHAAVLRDHGMSKNKRYWHEVVGYNYRLTNIQAAIGVAQFERLDEFVSAKQTNAQFYNQLFSSLNFFEIPLQDPNSVNSYWLYTCLVKENAPFKRDHLIEFLQQKGVETRPVFYPMHLMPPYSSFVKSPVINSIDISQRGISFPSSVNLSSLEMEYIKKSVHLFVEQFI